MEKIQNFEAPFLGAIDQGTSSSRFIIFDKNGKVVVMAQKEFDQICLQASWVEHDPMVIVDSVNNCIDEAIDMFIRMGLDIKDLKGVGITNQRETLVAWDKTTHKPLHNAIVWCDGRTQALVEKYQDSYNEKELQKLCGLPISTYFSALKIRWLIENSEAVKQALDNDNLMVGTIDSWLIYQYSLGDNRKPIHVTDVTNASRMCLMNIHTLKWDEKLLEFFQFPQSILPSILSSSETYCTFGSESKLNGIPIAGVLGDQQAAFVGQKCFTPGTAKNTYGTGCFMLFNTGEKPTFSSNGLLTTLGYKFGNQPAVYALEGSVAVAGSAIKWLRDNLNIIQTAPQIGELAKQVEDTAGVYFVTAFSGLLAPYWRTDARGCILGLTQYATKHHLARAALEATCFQTRAILEAMNKDSQQELTSLMVDGGMTNSDECMQIQADLLGIPVVRPAMRETSALGAAVAAGLALGIYKDLEHLNEVNNFGVNKFEAKIDQEARDSKFKKWNQAVEKSYDWAH
ncbi:glycerol kinase [Neoconidiobolus thromboides FSU 785]|nr:glycerol kinase [Neoconidiobolus thromboides FSU 785]